MHGCGRTGDHATAAHIFLMHSIAYNSALGLSSAIGRTPLSLSLSLSLSLFLSVSVSVCLSVSMQSNNQYVFFRIPVLLYGSSLFETSAVKIVLKRTFLFGFCLTLTASELDFIML